MKCCFRMASTKGLPHFLRRRQLRSIIHHQHRRGQLVGVVQQEDVVRCDGNDEENGDQIHDRQPVSNESDKGDSHRRFDGLVIEFY